MAETFENQPGNELDKVVIKGDAGASIKDGGVRVPNEVRGDHLQNTYAVSILFLGEGIV